ncbi:hypothetical protein CC2G_012223 [Coprinopsis cinerea AmutBmut pab1-1]|nr:hypothetical protein CC2G_012223 [Coprinopsis cinerea AmutBmut pab1-1]
MSLVDSTNVDKRGGWKKTSLGRIYRPIRMRPERPLPPTLEELAAMKKILKKRAAAMRGTKTKKPKLKAPPTRARKRTIDMTKWGSTLLKGIFLESQGSVAQMPTSEPMEEDKSSSSEDDEPVPVAPKQSQRQLPQRSPSPLPP